jgi:hypothetical protein
VDQFDIVIGPEFRKIDLDRMVSPTDLNSLADDNAVKDEPSQIRLTVCEFARPATALWVENFSLRREEKGTPCIGSSSCANSAGYPFSCAALHVGADDPPREPLVRRTFSCQTGFLAP